MYPETIHSVSARARRSVQFRPASASVQASTSGPSSLRSRPRARIYDKDLRMHELCCAQLSVNNIYDLQYIYKCLLHQLTRLWMDTEKILRLSLCQRWWEAVACRDCNFHWDNTFPGYFPASVHCRSKSIEISHRRHPHSINLSAARSSCSRVECHHSRDYRIRRLCLDACR